MQLLEQQGKRLLNRIEGLPVPRGAVASSPAQAAEVARGLGPQIVIKAQVPSGGRAKDGGVQFVTRTDAARCAESLLGRSVCGFEVHEVLVEERLVADREIYLAVALSARCRSPVLLLSAEGGVDVEAVPERVATVPVSPLLGLRAFHVWDAASAAGVERADVPALIAAARAVYRLFEDVEADLVEVNPVLRIAPGELVAADVRVVPSQDGAYLREHPGDVLSVADRAKRLGFDLVELDPNGHTGILSTGAGATMNLVDLFGDAGARPINFCDFRSGRAHGADERLRLVLDYLVECPQLRCLAVNFFAGVTDLDTFGEVLAAGLAAHPIGVPVVIRLEGSGAERARRRMRDVGALMVGGLDELVYETARISRSRVGSP
jgi:succinyl-CoA synthetase beta subunit